MSEIETFECARHGFLIPILTPADAKQRGLPVGCPECTAAIESAPRAVEMSGDDRAKEVRRLLTEPSTVAMSLIHERIAALVGRDVWTHELVNPDILAAEARDWQHPRNLEGHLLGTLRDAMGDKPIVIVRTQEEERK